ncbi:hypothetical protein CEXT_207841 [Caerostris extrusa]|uniref:Uncharacterized protein n=1 Tax=Caerostris extrusa TaxID=172846 RepID=A0AAV4TKQ5_CAEEX|nr:hypothetical protein CEXT_207841 [Caerostris extrusa]
MRLGSKSDQLDRGRNFRCHFSVLSIAVITITFRDLFTSGFYVNVSSLGPLMGARGSLFGIGLKMDTNLIERFEMSFLHNVSQFMRKCICYVT